jgi:hypothetical protein
MQLQADAGKPRGWLVVLGLAYVWFLLVNLYKIVDAGQRRTGVFSPLYGFSQATAMRLHVIDTADVIGRLCFIAVGFYLLALFVRRDRRVPRYFLGYGVAFLVFEAVMRAQYLAWLTSALEADVVSFWSNTAVCAALIIAWLVLLTRSRKVRPAFARAPVAARPTRTLLLGLADALIAWPFVTALFMDTTTELAGVISPQAASEGNDTALAFMASSVAAGLFILMKLVWRMKALWIVLLWPASLAVLAFAYTWMGFHLHFR